jgi:signal transduction histidine kinase
MAGWQVHFRVSHFDAYILDLVVIVPENNVAADDSILVGCSRVWRGIDRMIGKRISAWFGHIFHGLGHPLGERQVQETVRIIPLLVLFHFCAAIGISNLVSRDVPALLLRGWQAGVIVVALPLIYAAFRLSKPHAEDLTASLVLKFSPFVGVLLGVVWAVPIGLFSPYVALSDISVIYAMVLTMVSIGMISLMRLPLAGILFSLIVTAAISYSIFHNAAGYRELVGFLAFGLFAPALVSAILVSHRSMVRQWQTEAELIRQGQVIKLLLNDFERGTGDILWETDGEGRITYLSGHEDSNDQSAATMPSDIASALGLDPNDRGVFEQSMLAQDIIVNQVHHGAINLHDKHWLISARPLKDDNQRFAGFRGVARDVTWQRNQEELLLHAKDDAERANAAKSQFLAVISHELRTPINAIVGLSELLSKVEAENLPLVRRHEYLNTILESAKHLQSLINDILDVTRMERGVLQIDDQDNDVAELIEIALKICRDHATASGISLVGHVADNVLVTGDLTRLKQVILNLVTNAIKFSPQGGVVHVGMDRGPQRSLVISVRDAGIGISDADAERVFEPFVQGEGGANRRFNGLGLGLAISRKIARLHGGDVTLKGMAGGGSEARLILPAARVVWPSPKKSLKGDAAA